MKSNLAGMMLLALGLNAAGVAQAADAPKNLVANGGFEEAGENNASAKGWEFKLAARTEEKKHEGKYSLKFEVSADADKKQIYAQNFPAADSFKPGDVVEVSAFVMSTAKLGAGSSPRIQFEIFDANWKFPTAVSVAFPCEPVAEWKKVSGKVTVPAGYKSGWHVKCIVWLDAKPEKAGAIYVDDVQAVVLPAAAK